ncbi:MAG: hypothetical protein RL344_1228 [Pseudomonadota bacterium]|jgi:hypothetical protein
MLNFNFYSIYVDMLYAVDFTSYFLIIKFLASVLFEHYQITDTL